MEYIIEKKNEDHLEHHGVKGQKWGVRRYQNADGSLTNSGKKRYSSNEKTSNMSKEKATAPAGRGSKILVDYRPEYAEKMRKEAESFRKKTTDSALNNRIDKLIDWEKFGSEDNIKSYASSICKDVIMSRKSDNDRHKFLSRLSSIMDSTVYDDPSVMSVNKTTGKMRYNSCVKFDLNGVNMNSKTGKYDTRELDNILGHEPNSTYYYVYGELQNRD